MAEVYKIMCGTGKINNKWILAVSYNLSGSCYSFGCNKAGSLKTKGSCLLSKSINQFKYVLEKVMADLNIYSS